jgi:hypothetical protein
VCVVREPRADQAGCLYTNLASRFWPKLTPSHTTFTLLDVYDANGGIRDTIAGLVNEGCSHRGLESSFSVSP